MMQDPIGLINGAIFVSFILVGFIIGTLIMKKIERQARKAQRRASSKAQFQKNSYIYDIKKVL